MSNETKRDIFEQALADWRDFVFDVGYQGEELHGYCEFDATLYKYQKDYRTALPDDMPVIPEAVGEILRSAYGQNNLLDVLDTARHGRKISETLAWMFANQNTSATAFLLGTWRVEKTGEIVKLEEEK